MAKLGICALLFTATPAVALSDGLPPAPSVKFAGCVNGHLCITVGDGVVPSNLVFQVKSLDVSEPQWRTVDFTWQSKFIMMTVPRTYSYWWTMDHPGATLVRVAETNAVGTSDWSGAGPVTNHIRYVAAEMSMSAGGYVNGIVAGTVNTYRETNWSSRYQDSSNVWLGVYLDAPRPVSSIRFVPRQDASGLMRLRDVKVQCADDAGFLTNLVTLASLGSKDVALGKVIELPLDNVVTSRYFRFMKTVDYNGEYLSVDEIELVPPGFVDGMAISVVNSGDWTNNWPSVTWSIPAADLCSTGVLQRAISAAGPFADVSGWTDATTGETFVDSNIVVGVTYYYRVKAHCVSGGPLRGKMFYSDVVSFVRGRRLERSWDDLTKLNDGVSVMEAFKWVDGRTGNTAQPKKAFDGNIDTYCEATCYTNAPGEAQTTANRVYTPVVGVKLGAKYHVCGSLVYPRSDNDNNLERTRIMSICGADDEALDGVKQLSPNLGGFPTRMWQYNTTTNASEQFQYVFLWSPTYARTYGNVSEVGFFGYSDQDIVDSGLLIPPTTVSCETNSAGVVVSWDRGWNNNSYRVDRRRGTGEWMPVASLETNVFSYVDTTIPRRGKWSWRVTALSEDGEEISSVACTRYYDPRIGVVILLRPTPSVR